MSLARTAVATATATARSSVVPRVSSQTATATRSTWLHRGQQRIRSRALLHNYSQARSRAYSTEPPQPKKSSSLPWLLGFGAVAAAGGFYYYTTNDTASKASATTKKEIGSVAAVTGKPAQADYQRVYDAIAKRLADEDEYDDGSYGPVLLRLAWHASGTFDAATGTGGSNGATMRFDPEADHGANAGLKAARDFLEPVKAQFPWISYSDLWTLGGVTAIQEMQGPAVPWRPGRADRAIAFCTPDGRLPDGAKGADHLRAIFGRMGFSDREIVALSGAHALGRCHTDRSGFEGPWSFSPTVLTNDYYKLLLDEGWEWRKWNGPKQYEDKKTKSLMMLPTDMALIKDPVFVSHVKRYAKDEGVFFDEFATVVNKLMELGVPFKENMGGVEPERMMFKKAE